MIDRRLLVLRVLAEKGTVTGTAAALNYTPSAVSAQLRGLTEQLGVELLEPDGRRVRLTPAGRLLVERSTELFQRWEEIRASVAERSGTDLDLLRLCGFSAPAAALLPTLTTRLRERHPALRLRIDEADPAACFEMLLAETADLAVVVATQAVPAANDPRFEQRILLTDHLDLLVAEQHRLASRHTVAFTEVATEPWITDRVGSPYHQLFVTACLAAGFVPQIAHHAIEWETAAALVSAGLGTALIPRLARLPMGYPVRRIPLRGDHAPSRTVIVGLRAGSITHPVIADALEQLVRLANEIAPAD